MTHCDGCGWDDATYQHGAICGTQTVTPPAPRVTVSKGGRGKKSYATPAEKQRAYRERRKRQ